MTNTQDSVWPHLVCQKICLAYIILLTPFLVQTQFSLCCSTWEQTMVMWFCWNIQDWYKVIIVILTSSGVFFWTSVLSIYYFVWQKILLILKSLDSAVFFTVTFQSNIVLIDLSTHFNFSSYCSAHVWWLTGQVGTV